MTPSKLSKSVLAHIEEKHIEPIPKWHFVVRNILWWVLFVLSIILGGAGLAVIIFSITHQRFDFIDLFSRGGPSVWFGMLPFFWGCFFIGFVWISFWGITHTKKAYRIPRFVLILSNIILTLLWGTAVYSSGMTEHFERKVVKHVPFMKTIREQREHRWDNIEHGFLAGKVQSLTETELVIKRRSGEVFTVDIQKAVLRGGASVQEGDIVRFTGKLEENNFFVAETYGVFDPEKIKERIREHRGKRKEHGRRPPRRGERFEKGKNNFENERR